MEETCMLIEHDVKIIHNCDYWLIFDYSKNCGDIDEKYKCDNSTATMPNLEITSGQKHRVRFVNVGAFAEFEVQIDNHPYVFTFCICHKE